MAVNGVEIAVGQVWRARDGAMVKIERRDATDATYPWLGSDNDWYTDNGEYSRHGNKPGRNLIELVTDEHGFTIWRGGERPVPVDAKVTVRFEGGHISQPSFAGNYSWREKPGHGLLQIIGYKFVDAAQQPAPATLFDSASLAEETLIALGWGFDGTTWVEQPKASLPEWDGVARIEFSDTPDVPTMAVPGYELLSDVLHRAYNQAAVGKGKERHANGEPFDEQVMQDGARRFGVGALLFQAFKKSEESQRLPLDRGVNELLGAIVYLAGAVIRREADDPTKGAF